MKSSSAHLWTERYETLRRHFVENRRLLPSDPLDLTLLLGGGVAHWMSHWTAGTATISKAPEAAPERWRAATPVVALEPLTILLGQMTLQHLHPALKL